MTLQLRKAERKQAKMRIGLMGPSGSGKTYSSLLLASGITSWDKIALIDTENGSGELYADLGDYNVITLTAPFTPERYIEAIKTCEDAGIEVIIIDSISHEWFGEGGILEIHSKIKGVNSYMNWKDVTPRHNAFINKILQSSSHIITCARTKQEYVIATNERGQSVPTKVGLSEIQRDGFTYEVGVNFVLDISHFATADKDRTSLFIDKPPFKITPETGKVILEWANSGKEQVEFEPTETKDPVSAPLLEKLTAKADLPTINQVCGLNLKKIEHITQTQAKECLIKLMSQNGK